jgi:hypothetical protein
MADSRRPPQDRSGKIFKICVEDLITRKHYTYLTDKDKNAFTEKTVSGYAGSLARKHFKDNTPATIYIVVEDENCTNKLANGKANTNLSARLVYIHHQKMYQEMQSFFKKLLDKIIKQNAEIKLKHAQNLPPKKKRALSPRAGSPSVHQPPALMRSVFDVDVQSVVTGTPSSTAPVDEYHTLPPKKRRVGRK